MDNLFKRQPSSKESKPPGKDKQSKTLSKDNCPNCGKSYTSHNQAKCLRDAFGLADSWKPTLKNIKLLGHNTHLITAWGQPGPGAVRVMFVDGTVIETDIEADVADIVGVMLLKLYTFTPAEKIVVEVESSAPTVIEENEDDS